MNDKVHDSQRAQFKCRLLTSTYMRQSNRAVFNQFVVDLMCKIRRAAPETRQHFMVECQPLQEVRHNVHVYKAPVCHGHKLR